MSSRNSIATAFCKSGQRKRPARRCDTPARNASVEEASGRLRMDGDTSAIPKPGVPQPAFDSDDTAALAGPARRARSEDRCSGPLPGLWRMPAFWTIAPFDALREKLAKRETSESGSGRGRGRHVRNVRVGGRHHCVGLTVRAAHDCRDAASESMARERFPR